jgi:uncharacterized RDD family membrane protein YckC
MSHAQLDTTYLVETPEGIDLQAELAGPVPRVLAYAIDICIRMAVLTVLSVALFSAGNAGIGLVLLLSFLLEWFYPVFFEVYYKGQTLGKKTMGLVVVNDDLTPVQWGSSLTRNLLRAADFMPFAFLGGLLCMVMNQRFQRLGDIAAGTLVIYQHKQKSRAGLPDCQAYPPPVQLALEDQLALIGFAERSAYLSTSRQQELADILATVTHRTNADNINYLRGIGNWLLGVR